MGTKTSTVAGDTGGSNFRCDPAVETQP